MLDNTARMIGTVGIWLAVAVTLTFGVFRVSWNDLMALFAMVTIVAIVCTAATISTIAIWKPELLKNSFNKP